MKNGGNKVTMSEGVVYADVMFTKPQRTERKDDAAEAYCQVELKDKPRRCNPVTVVLLTLCVLLMGAVIGLGVLWNNKCPKHRVCASGWEFHGSKCYFFSTNKMNWTQSRDNCVSMGGHLVIINSLEEQTFLGDKVGSEMHEDEGKFWIGLTDGHHEGCWLWVDNTTLDLKKSQNVTERLHPKGTLHSYCDDWRTKSSISITWPTRPQGHSLRPEASPNKFWGEAMEVTGTEGRGRGTKYGGDRPEPLPSRPHPMTLGLPWGQELRMPRPGPEPPPFTV
ncbi:uncharacterized protein LOC105012767 [Esox lucius]|uniref:uncharacterized protein LOC105012767 n=1 Tax=Esox lucius TaxID=8010 RepID=UPI001477186B|nr:uncharacterized protein LOC105012767 [Esox lucius]